MKTKINLLQGFLALCGTLATTAAFGQVTQIWTGGNGTGTELGAATNWGGTLPNTANNDTGEFNGTVSGNLNLVYNTGTLASGYGQSGINLYLNASQTGSVNISTTVNGTSSPLAITGITIDSGAGAFTLGGPSSASVLAWVGRPAGAVHTLVNNSANTATLTPWILFTAGGGTTWTLDFQGTGNWVANSYLVDNNGPNKIIQVDGPGTVTWNPSGTLGANGIASPIVINGGALVLAGAHPRLSNQAITLGGNFEFNAPAQAQTLSGAISGSGQVQVNAGTLTLSGASSYTGNTILSGGELVALLAENPGTSGPLGEGGTISFTGGTLGFSVNNTYDYSSRFATTSGQAFSFDTAGQNVTLASALASSGGTLTKLGSGTLTLGGANTYSGATTISAGKLEIQGSAGSGSITLANSTTLGVTETGPQITPASLTVGTSASASLEFNNVSSTSTAPIAAGTVSAGGPITVNVASGTFLIGHSYPLLSWASGSAPAYALGTLTGAGGNLSVSGNTLYLNVTSLAYVWSGLDNANWDITTANNWKVNGVSQIFANGGTALFDDTASGQTNVVLNSPVSPGSVTINSSVKPYSITSSGANNIAGNGGLTKNGTTFVALSGGVNSYTGPTTLGGGTLSVGTLANGGSASDIGAANNTAASLVFNGGGLQYTGGGATCDHLFILGTAGGTIDNEGGQLTLSNPGAIGLSGTGARILTLTGSDVAGDTLAAVLGDNGGATAVTKIGAGKWVLTGNNANSGVTTIEGGELQIGTGGTTGAIGTGSVIDDGSLDLNLSSTLAIPGAISGSGSVTNDGSGTSVLSGNSSYSGGTTINNGTLQIGNGGPGGSLNASGFILDNGTFIFDSTTRLTLGSYGANITGTGNVIVRPGSFLAAEEANAYTGWTEIDPGGTFQPCYGNSGALTSSVVTNNGTLQFLRQDGLPVPAVMAYTGNIVGTGRVVKDNNNQNNGAVGLVGTNTYTGGTFIGGGGIILGDNATVGGGTIVGNVIFTNTISAFLNPRSLNFYRPDNFTFTNNIISSVNDGSTVANSGAVEQSGAGTVALTGNNNYPGGTTVDASTVLQVGAGGATGSIGTGAVTDNGELDFNLSSSFTFTNLISGSGDIVQLGSGTTTLGIVNTYTGSTTVSNGVLVAAGSVGGDLDVDGGVLAAGAAGSVANLNVAGNLNLNAGAILATLNKSLSPSNSTVTVSGGITVSGGSLVLTNFGPSLAVGDRFVIFNQATTGSGLTIQSKGFTVANNLATDGSVTVTSVTVTPTSVPITASYSSGVLSLSWPAGSGLHAQTNSLSVGLSSNWVNVGGVTGNSYSTTPGTAKGAVFYRLSQ